MREVIVYSLLHCHFESAFRALAYSRPHLLPQVRRVYAARPYQEATPAERLTMLWEKVLNLTDNEDIFNEITFRRIVQNLLDDMVASRVEHIDLRIGPSTGRWRWMRSLTDGLEVFSEELSQRAGLSISFLAGINLRKSEGQLDAIFDVLRNDTDVVSNIAGVDLNFFPSDLSKFERYLKDLRAMQADGLKVNLHLGELFDNDVSRYVLSRLTPNRIGHGVLLLRDKDLVAFIKDHDMCPFTGVSRVQVVAGGVQGCPASAWWMASMGRRPWLRALMR
jgi:adenosine deaminase